MPDKTGWGRGIEDDSKPKRRGRSLRSLTLVVLGLALLWVGSGMILRGVNSGKVMPGTTIGGIEVGGSTEESAADRISGAEPRVVSVRAPSKDFEVNAEAAGFDVDVEASVDSAMDAGRGDGAKDWLKGPAFLFDSPEADLVYQPVKEQKLDKQVDRIADEVDRAPFVGALKVNDKSLAVRVNQPRAGVSVRRAPTRDQLRAAFIDGQSGIDLPTKRRPAPGKADVRAVARDAEAYLQQPLDVSIGGNKTTIGVRQLADILAVESDESGDGAASVTLGVDPQKTRDLVGRVSKRFSKAPRDAQIKAPASPPATLAEQGDVTWRPKPGAAKFKSGRDGRRVNRGQAESAVRRAVQSGQHQARFVTEKVEADFGTGDAKSATSLIGTFTTNYDCCQPRVTNIQQMAATVDGTVINPGEQFSLNGIVGERTKAKGYKAAPSIGEGNELVDTVGGGVSQFSTTIYNAAYFAGLQIDTHTPHSFYISRYPPGREATLDFGGIEMIWTNDTNNPVVVRSTASDTSVTVSIYGGNGGRVVRSVNSPRRSVSGGDFEVTNTRVIRYSDGTKAREPYITTYGKPAD